MVCRPVVCVANILLNYAWQWLELEMEMGTRTHARSRTRTRIRNQNLNAPQMQLNLKWLKSHKRGHLSLPCCPEILPHTHIVCVLFYVPDICNCYVYGIKFQKIFQTLTAFACDTLSDHCVFGPPALHPLPYPFIFFSCPRLHIELRKSQERKSSPTLGYHLAKVSGPAEASVCLSTWAQAR